MQIAFGSAKMGESYLYWHGGINFNQHNVTISPAAIAWVNSPGFRRRGRPPTPPDSFLVRGVTLTTLTFRKERNHFTPGSINFSVFPCERCPVLPRDHVSFHRANPESQRQSHHQPPRFTRQSNWIFAGNAFRNRPSENNAFRVFRPGDRVSDQFRMTKAYLDENSVHTSNQLNRCLNSKCFQEIRDGRVCGLS